MLASTPPRLRLIVMALTVEPNDLMSISIGTERAIRGCLRRAASVPPGVGRAWAESSSSQPSSPAARPATTRHQRTTESPPGVAATTALGGGTRHASTGLTSSTTFGLKDLSLVRAGTAEAWLDDMLCLAENGGAHLGLAQVHDAFGQREIRDRSVARTQQEGMTGLPTDEHAEGSSGNLGVNVGALFDCVDRSLEELLPEVGGTAHLKHCERDGLAGLGAQPHHPVHLLQRCDHVFTSHSRRRQFEDASAAVAKAMAEREQLVFGRERSWDRLAVHGTMRDRSAGRHAKGTGGNGVAHDGGHRCDLGGIGRFVSGTARTHDVGANGPVSNLRTDVDTPAPLVERVEILGEGFPLPCNAFAERGAGDVLDAFHQLNQPFF